MKTQTIKVGEQIFVQVNLEEGKKFLKLRSKSFLNQSADALPFERMCHTVPPDIFLIFSS